VEGGDFALGKTSNIELDEIYQAYLPGGCVLPCDTLPKLSPRKVEEIKNLTKKLGLVYFPLFIRQHWIAGLLRYDEVENEFSLTIHDSAPSIYVHQDLGKIFQEAWPDLVLLEGWCAQQKRGSEDCGIFMTAIFFANHTKTRLKNGHNLPARLRPFLASWKKNNLPKGEFIRRMVSLLKGKELQVTLAGGEPSKGHKNSEGNKKHKKVAKKTTVTPSKARAIAPLKMDQKRQSTDQKAKREKVLKKASNPPKTPKRSRKTKRQSDCVLPPPHKNKPESVLHGIIEKRGPQLVDEHVDEILEKVKKSQKVAAQRQLCYFLTATAMINVADGTNFSLNVESLASQASRRGFKAGEQYDVGEALAARGKVLDFMVHDSRKGTKEILRRSGFDPSTQTQAWFIQNGEGRGLPQQIFSHSFKIGAKYTGKLVTHANGLKAGVSGHYEITTKSNEACFGVYLPLSMKSYNRRSRPKNALKLTEEFSASARPLTSRALTKVSAVSTASRRM